MTTRPNARGAGRLFKFLQFIDENYEKNNSAMVGLLNNYFSQRYSGKVSAQDMLPLINLHTTLSTLFFPLMVSNQIPEWEGFNLRKYSITVENCKCPEFCNVIKIIRDALAHLPDSIVNSRLSANVSFNKGYIEFSSGKKDGTLRGRVIFNTAEGIRSFLQDFLLRIKGIVEKKLLLIDKS